MELIKKNIILNKIYFFQWKKREASFTNLRVFNSI